MYFDVLEQRSGALQGCTVNEVCKRANFGNQAYYASICIKRNYPIRLKQFQIISLLVEQKAENLFCSPSAQKISGNATVSRMETRILKA